MFEWVEFTAAEKAKNRRGKLKRGAESSSETISASPPPKSGKGGNRKRKAGEEETDFKQGGRAPNAKPPATSRRTRYGAPKDAEEDEIAAPAELEGSRRTKRRNVPKDAEDDAPTPSRTTRRSAPKEPDPQPDDSSVITTSRRGRGRERSIIPSQPLRGNRRGRGDRSLTPIYHLRARQSRRQGEGEVVDIPHNILNTINNNNQTTEDEGYDEEGSYTITSAGYAHFADWMERLDRERRAHPHLLRGVRAGNNSDGEVVYV